jgi:hypothetical protein
LTRLHGNITNIDHTRQPLSSSTRNDEEPLGTGQYQGIVKGKAAGLVQLQPAANNGRGDQYDFKKLVQIELRTNVFRW